MALDTQRQLGGVDAPLVPPRRFVDAVLARAATQYSALAAAGAAWSSEAAKRLPAIVRPGGRPRSEPWRLFTRTIWRRIIVSNLIGFLVFLAGTWYLNQNHAWLIDAKMESLRTQGRIIAQAIAANVRVDADRIVLDPDKLSDSDAARFPLRDTGLAALELSIPPERVGPVLKRLIQPTKARARVYGTEGTLIVDSNQLLARGQISRADMPPPGEAADQRIHLKSSWSRFLAWVIRGKLPVYHEIGTANGLHYGEVQTALGGVQAEMLLLSEFGERIVSVATPIQQLKVVQGVLLLSTRPGEIDEVLWKEQRMLLTIALLALVATTLAALLLARTIANPMRKLSEAAEHVSRNINARRELPDLSRRTDEVGQMAVAFRNMTAALYRRIEASDRFAQDVAHELKNPLAAARSMADSLAYTKTDEQRREMVGHVQGELKRLNKLITDIAAASRLDAELARQETERVDIRALATGIVGVFADIGDEDAPRIELEVSDDDAGRAGPVVSVLGHEGRLGQVITNLIDNAVSFSPADGVVRVIARRTGAEAEIVIEDQGPGIPPNKLDDIFKRFYSDRPQSDRTSGKNSGLGLSISREIVEAHGGRMWAENRRPRSGEAVGDNGHPDLEARRVPGVAGARIVVRLPAAGAQSARGAQAIGRRS